MSWISEKNRLLLHNEGIQPGDAFTIETVRSLAKEHPALDFEDVVTIVKHVNPDHFLEIMGEYCRTTNKLASVKAAFEFASLYLQKELLEFLINRHQEDELLKDWCDAYEIKLRYLTGHLKAEDMIGVMRAELTPTSDFDLIINNDIMEVISFYRVREYSASLYLAQQLEEKIQRSSNGFLKTTFSARLGVHFAITYLYAHNDLVKAENYALSVLVNPVAPQPLIAAVHHTLSLIYLFTNEDRSLEHLNIAIEMFRELGNQPQVDILLQDDLILLKNVYGKSVDLNGRIDLNERAHQYIVRGDYKKALDTLALVDSTGNTSYLSEFYKAKASKDPNQYVKALRLAIKSGNVFYSEWYLREMNSFVPTKTT
ncbi:AimR family lysis-lysogeny pheromone receptor [Shouchella shacheensis]|uniref:AimR family lysis-lysogeny pheromone receptor n=1 Tax=Shouchella shacheensis TaxID=1649580 RepID=UPI00074020EB|nr:AimR family lysis-lysogeny pheromone receptor [Shouchella shacheensis]